MNDIQIHDLKTADKEILKEIFKINESYNPFLGPLKTLDNLIELIQRSNYSIFLTNKKQICAFLVCFRENSKYQSKNYKFFKKRFNRFFYIDRIGVVKGFKNKGLGTFIYNKIVWDTFDNKKDILNLFDNFNDNKACSRIINYLLK